jgi:molybdopterin converting factor small subunit
MLTVTVSVYANLREYTGGQATVEVDLPDGATIRTVIDHLGIPAEQTRIVFVDHRAAGLDDALRSGQRIDLFSAIGGG